MASSGSGAGSQVDKMLRWSRGQPGSSYSNSASSGAIPARPISGVTASLGSLPNYRPVTNSISSCSHTYRDRRNSRTGDDGTASKSGARSDVGSFISPSKADFASGTSNRNHNHAPVSLREPSHCPLSFKYRLVVMASEFEALELEYRGVKEELRLVRQQQEEDHGGDGGQTTGGKQSTPGSPNGERESGEGGGKTPTGLSPGATKSWYLQLHKKATPGLGCSMGSLSCLDEQDTPGDLIMDRLAAKGEERRRGSWSAKSSTAGDGDGPSVPIRLATQCCSMSASVIGARRATPSASVIGVSHPFENMSPASETSLCLPSGLPIGMDHEEGQAPVFASVSEVSRCQRSADVDFLSGDMSEPDVDLVRSGHGVQDSDMNSAVSSQDMFNILPLVNVTKTVSRMSRKVMGPTWSHDWMERREEEDACLQGFHGGVLAPKRTGRVLWDVAWCFFCALELYVLPGQKVLDWNGIVSKVIMFIISMFFCADLIVNFSTGYYDRDGRCVMKRTKIIKNYLNNWFLIDLLAWVPIDFFMLDLLRWNCILRVAKIPVVGRRVWMRAHLWPELRCRGSRIMRPDTFDKVALGAKGLLAGAACAFALHLHACVWMALVDIDHMRGDHPYHDHGHRAYLQSLCEVFLTFAVPGSLALPMHWDPDGPTFLLSRVFQVLVALERLAIAAYIIDFLMLRLTQHMSNDNAAILQVKENALKYLKRNSVSPETQNYVMRCLNDTRSVNMIKQHFMQISTELPPTLTRRICREMWESSLVSLQLINHMATWCPDFISELVTIVFEDTIPAAMLLFEKDGLSHDAFYILDGTLHSPDIPEETFTEDEWVGETCLINPSLCSGLTMATKTLCRLMVVPAKEFHNLIDTLDIQEQFSLFCSNNLFRGICGRCGAFGDHMATECPKNIKNQEVGIIRKAIMAWGAKAGGDDQCRALCRDLKEFLRAHNLERLTPGLQHHDIYNTDDLIEMVKSGKMDFQRVDGQECGDSRRGQLVAAMRSGRVEGHAHVVGSDDGKICVWLEESEERALSVESIERFQKRLFETIKHTVNYNQKIDMDQQHLIFLSHYKVEAGTEASLMRAEMLQAMDERDPSMIGKLFDVPVFLDSEDLRDLSSLRQQVLQSHNLALLLSEGVLTRPWCLLEVVMANQFDVPIIPIEVIKPGIRFQYPDNKWYKRLLAGQVLTDGDMEILTSYKVNLHDVSVALRALFRNIAVQYSPHRSAQIRSVEVEAFLERCVLCDDLNARNEAASHQVKDTGYDGEGDIDLHHVGTDGSTANDSSAAKDKGSASTHVQSGQSLDVRSTDELT